MRYFMVKYKYYIRNKDGKVYFGLYPNNSNIQPIGISILFNSYSDAFEALTKFKSYISMNKDKIFEIFEIEKINGKFSYKLYDCELGTNFSIVEKLMNKK